MAEQQSINLCDFFNITMDQANFINGEVFETLRRNGLQNIGTTISELKGRHYTEGERDFAMFTLGRLLERFELFTKLNSIPEVK